MKRIFASLIALIVITDLSSSAVVSKKKVIALRNALNSIIKDNEIQVETQDSNVACPFHACTAEILGCEKLKVNENGCPLCECAENRGACMLMPDPGKCKGRLVRYYFDRSQNSCQKFFYGGCGGNENNFEALEDCNEVCGGKVEKSSNIDSPIVCPLHSCTAKMLGCPSNTGLAKNENGCELCECAVKTPPVACPMHNCNAEMLKCPAGTGLAINENGCELCKCAVVAPPVACPMHSCNAEMLKCPAGTGLAINENGCELCKCAVDPGDGTVVQPAAETESDKGRCMLKQDPGPCRAMIQRYYFDRAANKCQQFIYGGCHGNNNNFETLEQCVIACGGKTKVSVRADSIIRCPLHGCTSEILGCPTGTDLAKDENGCTLCKCAVVAPPVACPMHSCNAEMLKCPAGTGLAINENGCELCKCAVVAPPVACPMHSCNAEMLKCPAGTGLAINENGCELCKCAVDPGDGTVVQPAAETELDKGRCMLKQDPGPCRAMLQRYYFDRAANKCQQFIYGGCHGNNNKFETLEECVIACGGKTKVSVRADSIIRCPLHGCTSEILGCPTGTDLAKDENGCTLCKCAVVAPPVACPMHSCTAEMLKCPAGTGLAINENGCELCKCAVVAPPVACPMHSCNAEMLKCPAGTGLAINENGCELCKCAVDPGDGTVVQPAAETELDKGRCMLKQDPGPCRAMLQRYYFDRAANKCQQFIYGGCHGNNNNFETFDDCHKVCGGKSLKVPLAESPPVRCPLHSCSVKTLDCPAGSNLAKDENGCNLCKCSVSEETEETEETEAPLVACPTHACTKESLGCNGELVKNENGCDLCECATLPVACPMHNCDAETLKCPAGLEINENGCKLCKCAEETEGPLVACPTHACTKESLGCEEGLAKNENGCDLCECAEPTVVTKCEAQKEYALSLLGEVQDGPFVPVCEEDGSYSQVQCYITECWCVNSKDGKEIYGTRQPNHKIESINCKAETIHKPIPSKKSGKNLANKAFEDYMEELMIENV